jgi:thiosulfate reductase cytochrome b subunit
MEAQTVHPRHIRTAHWVNAAALLILLWTGLAQLVMDRHYAAYVHLIPTPVWSALQLTGHKVIGRAWHLALAIVFMANAVFYAATSFASGSWRRLQLRGNWLRDAWTATIEEITKPRASLEQANYNPAQRLMYVLVMAAGAVMILTGLGLWFGRQLHFIIVIFGGKSIATAIHIVLALALLAFIVVHVAQVVRAGWSTLLGMLSGRTVVTPMRTRRALAWSGVVVASIVAFFATVTATSGPKGVPAFLRWTVESHRAGPTPERASVQSAQRN